MIQRQVLYLGEINDSQRAAWSKAIEVFDEGTGQSKQIALFPEDRLAPVLDCDVVSIRLSEVRLRRPRQWGACWMATLLWDQLRLDEFWLAALPPSREGTSWLNILKTLVSYQLISPGSEWRLHRHWFEHSAMGDLLGEDIALVQPNNLYRCLDKLTPHKQAMFTFLCERWKDLFQADFEVLLYDLTSTYFECDPPDDGKRKFGYSRDKRSDCVQVVIALIVTPDGFPLAYEVMDGNTSDKTTLKEFLAKIEKQYGKAKRTWVMDRGIPTEEVLAEMRNSETPLHYLVGSPRGRLTQLEKAFLTKPWEDVRESVQVKLIEHEEETYVLARSQGRRDKEQSMRRRRLKKLIRRLRELQRQDLTRDDLLLKLGAAKKEAGKTYALLVIHTPTKDQPVTSETFHFALDRKKLRQARRREGSYLLRSNLKSDDPSHLWRLKETIDEVIEDLSDHVDQPPAAAPAPEPFALETSGGSSSPLSSALTLAPNSGAIVAAPLPDLPHAGLTPSQENEKPILCIAGRSFLDEAAAALFAQILEKHGMGAKVGPAGALTAGRISSLSAEGVRLVCLSYFDADLSTAGARFAVRCVRRRLGEVKILAGFWLSGPGQANELCAATKADFCAARFKEALAFCLHEVVEVEKGEPDKTREKPAV